MSQYCPTLLNYFADAQPSSDIPAGAISAERTSPVCADHVRLDVSFAGDAVEAVSYAARGCVGVIGLAHLVSQRIPGLRVEEIAMIDAQALIADMEFVDPEHTHAFELVADTLADIAREKGTVDAR